MPVNSSYTQSFSKLDFFAKNIVEGFLTGLHRSPFHGFSVEFSEHKIYNEGDSIKDIDWKLYARTEKLYLKKYEEETNLRCHILVDCSSSMNFPTSDNTDVLRLNKKGFSFYAAASLMHLMKKQRDAVGLTLFNEEVTFNSPLKNTSNHVSWLIDQMESELTQSSKEKKTTNLIDAINHIGNTSKSRSLIVLFTDFIPNIDPQFNEKLNSAVRHLKHKQHEVVVFHVIDKKHEVELQYENRPYKFKDKESSVEIKINPAEVKEEYKKLKSLQLKEIRNSFLTNNIDYVESDTSDGFKDVLLTYLLKRKKF